LVDKDEEENRKKVAEYGAFHENSYDSFFLNCTYESIKSISNAKKFGKK